MQLTHMHVPHLVGLFVCSRLHDAKQVVQDLANGSHCMTRNKSCRTCAFQRLLVCTCLYVCRSHICLGSGHPA